MSEPVETEIKLSASPGMLDSLRGHPQLAGEDCASTLVTTYFDTADARLGRQGAILRVRDSAGSRREMTFKLQTGSGASVRRMEWNATTHGETPDPAGFPLKARLALLRLLDGAALAEVATTTVVRTSRRIGFRGATIAIAFDLGEIRAGERVETLSEFEMELVEGRLADVLALALLLPLGPGLAWSARSKADRCLALAFGQPQAAAHAAALSLSPAMNVAAGFQAIAWNCLAQLLANYPLVTASGDPEAVHQARVAIRRLRAAGSLFRAVTRDEAGEALRAELKAVATSLGPARDLHVLRERVAQAAASGEGDLDELVAELGARRDAAVRAPGRLLAGEQFQRLLFRFALWLEEGEWLDRLEETGGDRLLVRFASRVLSRRRRRFRRVGDHLSDLPDPVLHGLRIDGKKLRYAVEFFASLHQDGMAAKDRQSFARALRRLQSALGDLNDMAVAGEASSALFSGADPITAARLTARLDGLLESHERSRRKLCKRADRALARVAEAPAWWKAR